MAAASTVGARIAVLLEPIVLAAGFDLEDVEVSLARGNRRAEVRVLVDKVTGIDLDDVAAVSRLISMALDADPDTDRVLGEGMYVLEVSSPGVDRPLREPRHWRRNIGRLVTVTAAGKELTGRILEVEPEGIRLEVVGIKGRPSKTVAVAFADLGQGRVQVEFNRPSVLDDTDDLDETDDVADLDDADDADDEFDDELNDETHGAASAQEEAR
jgi:ribosome maturation factor RimP